MSGFRRGDIVEFDGVLAVIVGTPDDGTAPEDHLALWFGESQRLRKSQGGSGGHQAEVWTVPAEYCTAAAPPIIRH